MVEPFTMPCTLAIRLASSDVWIARITGQARPAAPAPSGIVAGAEGTLYFVDSFTNTVWRLRPGKVLTPFITGRNGRALQMDAEGNIYGTPEDEWGLVRGG